MRTATSYVNKLTAVPTRAPTETAIVLAPAPGNVDCAQRRLVSDDHDVDAHRTLLKLAVADASKL